MVLDPNATQKDALLEEGQPSFETQEASDKDLVEIFTKEDVAKRHSKLDGEIARLNKEVERLKPFEQRAVDLTRRDEAREYEEAKKDPEKLAAYQHRSELRNLEARLKEKEQELAEREAEHKELMEAGYKAKTIEVAQAIAKEHGVEATDLLGAGLQTPEEMKVFAGKLAKVTAQIKASAVPKPDSGLGGGGGGGTPTIEQLERMTPDEYAQWYKSRQEKK